MPSCEEMAHQWGATPPVRGDGRRITTRLSDRLVMRHTMIAAGITREYPTGMLLVASHAFRIRLATTAQAEVFCRDAAHEFSVELSSGMLGSATSCDVELLVDLPNRRILKLRAEVTIVESPEGGLSASIRVPNFSMERAAKILRLVASSESSGPDNRTGEESFQSTALDERAKTERCVPLPLRAAPTRPRRRVRPSNLYRTVTSKDKRPRASITFRPMPTTSIERDWDSLTVAVLCLLILICVAMIATVG